MHGQQNTKHFVFPFLKETISDLCSSGILRSLD